MRKGKEARNVCGKACRPSKIWKGLADRLDERERGAYNLSSDANVRFPAGL